jgi:hypothetical protein
MALLPLWFDFAHWPIQTRRRKALARILGRQTLAGDSKTRIFSLLFFKRVRHRSWAVVELCPLTQRPIVVSDIALSRSPAAVPVIRLDDHSVH